MTTTATEIPALDRSWNLFGEHACRDCRRAMRIVRRHRHTPEGVPLATALWAHTEPTECRNRRHAAAVIGWTTQGLAIFATIPDGAAWSPYDDGGAEDDDEDDDGAPRFGDGVLKPQWQRLRAFDTGADTTGTDWWAEG